MKIRLSIAGLALAAIISPLACPHDAAAQASGDASADVLNDGVLRSLGIERSWIKENDKLRIALKEAMERFQVGDGNGTLEKLKEAQKADTSLPPGELMLARLLIAINDINRGRQLLDQVFSLDQETPEVYVLLGNLALGEGRLTDAYLEYTRAGEYVGAQNSDKDIVGTRWTKERRDDFLREVYSGKAAVFEQLRNWDKAKNELMAWEVMNADDPLVHLRKGRMAYLRAVTGESPDEKKFDDGYNDAKKEFTLAYEGQKNKGVYKNDPVMERPEVVLLQLHTLANKLDRARAEIKALESQSSSIEENKDEASRIYTQISTWYLRQGEFPEAQKYATKATEFDKNSPALKSLTAMLEYYSNDPKAEDDFAKMHADNPGDFFASNYLALILSETDDPTKVGRAVQLAELNARLNQQSAEALSTLGWCYYKADRPQDAIRVMQVFTSGAQISPDTAYYFAKVLFALPGRKLDDVINLLSSAIDAKGPFKHRKEAESWMRGIDPDFEKKRKKLAGNAVPTVPAVIATPAATPSGTAPKANPTPPATSTNP